MVHKDANILEIARKLVELQRQLLESLPSDSEEVEVSVRVDGRKYTIRALWGRCVLVACQERGNGGSDESADSVKTLKLPNARDARTG